MKNDKKKIIIGLFIGILISLFYTHFFASRYEIKNNGLDMIRIDKWTGQTWTLVNKSWKKMSDSEQDWSEIDKALGAALKIPFAQVDSESALKKLKETAPVLKDVPNEELLERIKLFYSKTVLVNMYLGDFLKTSEKAPPEITPSVAPNP